MRTIAIAVGSMVIAASVPAFAQDHGRNEAFRAVADQERECWNPGAGHFERVRPGERQGAGHYEVVRPGERQDDLDFSRCR